MGGRKGRVEDDGDGGGDDGGGDGDGGHDGDCWLVGWWVGGWVGWLVEWGAGKNNYISQLPINRSMAALLVVKVIVID